MGLDLEVGLDVIVWFFAFGIVLSCVLGYGGCGSCVVVVGCDGGCWVAAMWTSKFYDVFITV